ncbi:MAG: cytochrome P460 family protein, partial [Gammaproteobacteria bacterium]
IGSGERTTGRAQWATGIASWFVMIKDTEGRFKASPHWGDGWGWALFQAENPAVNDSKGYAESCQGCHIPAKHNDWVYLEGYPTLAP